jgi:hypothetical protein
MPTNMQTKLTIGAYILLWICVIVGSKPWELGPWAKAQVRHMLRAERVRRAHDRALRRSGV